MHSLSRPKVLILTFDEQLGRRWSLALADAAELVSTTYAGSSQSPRFDVLVTDFQPDIQQGRAAVLAIANTAQSWADVTLPLDLSPREMQLACVLLAEIARVRRERDRLLQTHDEIRRLADTDPLTGLANRRAWEQRLTAQLARQVTGPGDVWLAVVDLDQFKRFNDRAGMAEGDRVLQQASAALAGELTERDTIARLGGDEFGVLLCGVDEQGALVMLGRLRGAVGAVGVGTVGGPLTLSIGYASARQFATAGELFAAAEGALRQAKSAGGNRERRGEGG